MRGRNVFLDIGVDLETNQVEDKDDDEDAPKEFLELVDKRKRIFQPNIKSSPKVNLEIDTEPRFVTAVAKLEREL